MYKEKGIIYILVLTVLGFIVQNVSGLIGSLHSETQRTGNVYKPAILKVYTWADYIDPQIFSEFEKEFNVKIYADFYEDEEMILSALHAHPKRYDVIFPSDSMTDVMVEAGLLMELEMHHIPNTVNLRDIFRNITNRKWKGYGIPLDWGITGIAYNSKYVKESVDSWNIFMNSRYAGRMALLDEGYDVMMVGQRLLGYSLNPVDPKEMDESLKILKTIKPLLWDRGFIPYNQIIDGMKSEVLWIAQCYNGDAARINEESSAIKFIIPKEGTPLWLDNMAIPVGSRNKHLAEKFINFMLRPEIAAKHTNYSYYANCNKKAAVFVDKEILNNPYVYISRKESNKLKLYEILDPNVQKRYYECWKELRGY